VDCGAPCPSSCSGCDQIECGNFGSCNSNSNPATCTCTEGYTDIRCSTPPKKACDGVQCGAHGSCLTGVCVCEPNYTGNECESKQPTCVDSQKNGDEEGVDCGGGCDKACTGTPFFQVGEWGLCSKSCEGGTRSRSITCVYEDGTAAPDACAHRLVDTEDCGMDTCPAYTWTFSAWGMCDKPCGIGDERRLVKCLSSIGDTKVDEKNCDGGLKPEDTRGCNLGVCVENYLLASEWSDCTQQCGGGGQTRSMQCMSVTTTVAEETGGPDETLTQTEPAADEAICTIATSTEQQACNMEACRSFEWIMCEWDECTAQCGGGNGMLGTKHRKVYCQDMSGVVVDPSVCDQDLKPTDISTGCNVQPCTGYNWMADGPFGMCINGTQTRNFHCHEADGAANVNRECEENAGPKPRSSRACMLWSTCPEPAVDTAGSETETDVEKTKTKISPASRVARSLPVTLLLTIVPMVVGLLATCGVA
jgi:hypothetical protein